MSDAERLLEPTIFLLGCFKDALSRGRAIAIPNTPEHKSSAIEQLDYALSLLAREQNNDR